jgi:parvulin-like peptidyl-prolyl isomerase
MRAFKMASAIAFVAISTLWAQQLTPTDVVVDANGTKITVSDVYFEFGRLTQELQQQVASDAAAKKEFINQIVSKKLISAKAKEAKLDTFTSVKVAIGRATEDIYAQAMVSFIQQSVAAPAEEEIKNFYTKNDTLWNVKNRYTMLQMIFNKKDVADDASKMLKSGKSSWEETIKKNQGSSNSPSGDTIALYEDQIVPDARTAITKIGVNNISEPILINNLYYIIKVLKIEPPRKVTFEEVKDGIKQKLMQDKANEDVKKFRDDTVSKSKITIDNAIMDKINFSK